MHWKLDNLSSCSSMTNFDSYSWCDVDKMLRQRFVSKLKSNDCRSCFMSSMFNKHCVRSSYQHRAVLAIVAGIERNAKHKAIGLNRMLVDGSPEPWCVHRLGVEVSKMSKTILSQHFFLHIRRRRCNLTAPKCRLCDLCDPSTSISRNGLRWMMFWRQTSDSLA